MNQINVQSENEEDLTTHSAISVIFEWLDVVVFSVVAVVIIFTFLFRIVSIDGDSMQNTLHNQERVIISNLFYEPARGDIVVLSKNVFKDSGNEAYSKPIIKRIIATEGETVDIDYDKGVVLVNGKALDELYIKEPMRVPTSPIPQNNFPATVPKNCVFVMGDNRNDSLDSRFSIVGDNGMINVKNILGHAVFRIFPLNTFGELIHK